MAAIEPEESLTLDDAAMTRAAEALGLAIEHGHSNHYCAEWSGQEGVTDGCEICWDIAADIVRAAEGLRKCPRCNGMGKVEPGDCCPSCGGDGLEPL